MFTLASPVEEIVRRALRSTAAPSLSVALIRAGETCVKAFGAGSPRSVYNIASLTKQFTAACVLLMVRDGALALEDPIARWFPHLTRSGDVRVAHLLSHTSGYPDYYPLGFADEEKLSDMAPEEIVRRYATLPLQFEPGSAWSYSNTGYHILGLIAERVSEMPYGDVLKQRVLEPAGMSASFFNDPPRITERHARGHSRFCLGPIREVEPERAGWVYAAGGLASTAPDLAQWQMVLMRGELLKPDEIAVMTRAFVLSGGSASPMGFGWFVENRGGQPVLQHSGGVAGFSSYTVASLPKRTSIVVLSNGDHVQTGLIANELFELLLPGAKPPEPVAVPRPEHVSHIARKWIERLRQGVIDRVQLTPQFSTHLTQSRLDDARVGLSAGGGLKEVRPIAAGERGGMSWYKARAEFASMQTDILLRETPDGLLAEFNAYPVP